MPAPNSRRYYLIVANHYAAAIKEGYPLPDDKVAAGAGKMTAVGIVAQRLGITTNWASKMMKRAAKRYPEVIADAMEGRATIAARKAAARRGEEGFSPVLPGYEISRTSVQLDAEGNVKKTYVTQRPEHGEVFAVPEGHVIKGVSALLDAEGRKVAEWVKTRENDTGFSIENIKAAFEGFEWKPIEIPTPADTDDELLTVYPIADLHLALKATADESGEDYDLEIASRTFEQCSDRLFSQSLSSSTALVVWLGDTTHADDTKNLTPSSKHHLQVSDDIYLAVRRAIQLAIAHIYKALERHRRVIVKVLRGNHDLHAWIGLCVAVEEHFRSNDRVTVDTGTADYWFLRWGVSLLGFHHGHRLKPEQMAGSMAVECREDWGETHYRHFWHGHLHHRRTIEVLGVLVECMRTLAPADQHHSGKYGAVRSLISITLGKREGETGRAIVQVKPAFKRAVAA